MSDKKITPHDALEELKKWAYKGVGEVSTDLDADAQRIEFYYLMVENAL